MFRILVLFLIPLLLWPAASMAGSDTIVLATVEWPPYAGKEMPGYGASAHVVRKAFEAVGVDVEIRIFPWLRGMDEVLHNPDVVGYFPEYHAPERVRSFLFSSRIGTSPLGVAERKGESTRWSVVEDLKGVRIGVVDGYVNEVRFDALVQSGAINVDKAVSDQLNLRKLLSGRVDMAIVDLNVLDYFMSNDPFLRSRTDELVANSHLLAIHDLHVCFSRDAAGAKALRLFEDGLKKINPITLQREYLKTEIGDD